MDKKSIIGIAVVAVLFLGFAYFNSQQQKEYQEQMARYEAYQDSVAAATRPQRPLWIRRRWRTAVRRPNWLLPMLRLRCANARSKRWARR